jgi:hypothetical protein
MYLARASPATPDPAQENNNLTVSNAEHAEEDRLKRALPSLRALRLCVSCFTLRAKPAPSSAASKSGLGSRSSVQLTRKAETTPDAPDAFSGESADRLVGAEADVHPDVPFTLHSHLMHLFRTSIIRPFSH